ncbi:MAG: hypothetical protein AB7F86_05680, partial [Bdellovibrionales bacterium]
GDCPSPDGKHADASVSDLSEKASICLSIGNLQRLPPGTLKFEVWALLVHEAAHLGGAKESEAQRLQDEFRRFLTELLPEKKSEIVRKSVVRRIQLAQLALSKIYGRVSRLANQRESSDLTLRTDLDQQLAEVTAKIDEIPLILEPLRLNYYLNPRRSEFHDDWANALVSTRLKIEFSRQAFSYGHRATLAELKINLGQALMSAARAAHNFRVYLFGRGEIDCQSPEKMTFKSSRGGAGVGRAVRSRERHVDYEAFQPIPKVESLQPDKLFTERFFAVSPPRDCSTGRTSNRTFEEALEISSVDSLSGSSMLSHLKFLSELQKRRALECADRETKRLDEYESRLQACIENLAGLEVSEKLRMDLFRYVRFPVLKWRALNKLRPTQEISLRTGQLQDSPLYVQAWELINGVDSLMRLGEQLLWSEADENRLNEFKKRHRELLDFAQNTSEPFLRTEASQLLVLVESTFAVLLAGP